MINSLKRGVAKELLDKFRAGEISNDDFDNDFPRDRNDAALGSIYERLWFLWDDRRKHRLTGTHRLGEEEQALFERCMAFLSSNLEYEWPPMIRARLSLILLRAFSFHRKAKEIEQREVESLGQLGNLGVWPFIRQEDYARAMQSTAESRCRT